MANSDLLCIADKGKNSYKEKYVQNISQQGYKHHNLYYDMSRQIQGNVETNLGLLKTAKHKDFNDKVKCENKIT